MDKRKKLETRAATKGSRMQPRTSFRCTYVSWNPDIILSWSKINGPGDRYVRRRSIGRRAQVS